MSVTGNCASAKKGETKAMKNIAKLAVMLAAMACTTACVGERATIQTGEVGKQLTSSGLEKEIRKPGSFLMDYCGTFQACPKLVRLQVNKSTADLEIDSLFLPKSNVDIKNVKVGPQFQVKDDAKSIERVYNEVRPEHVEGSSQVLIITDDMVYETFLKRKAPDAIISALRDRTVEEVLVNVPEIAGAVRLKVNELVAGAPI